MGTGRTLLPELRSARNDGGSALRRPGDFWTGALAGYAASRIMDAATTWFYGRQSTASKRREQELAPGGTLVQLGKQVGGVVGQDLPDAAAGRLGMAIHRTFGVTYGVLANALVSRGVSPLVAGLGVGAAAWALIDEGTSLPLFKEYRVVSHARGVVGHGTYGLAVGLLLRLIHRQ